MHANFWSEPVNLATDNGEVGLKLLKMLRATAQAAAVQQRGSLTLATSERHPLQGWPHALARDLELCKAPVDHGNVVVR